MPLPPIQLVVIHRKARGRPVVEHCSMRVRTVASSADGTPAAAAPTHLPLAVPTTRGRGRGFGVKEEGGRVVISATAAEAYTTSTSTLASSSSISTTTSIVAGEAPRLRYGDARDGLVVAAGHVLQQHHDVLELFVHHLQLAAHSAHARHEGANGVGLVGIHCANEGAAAWQNGDVGGVEQDYSCTRMRVDGLVWVDGPKASLLGVVALYACEFHDKKLTNYSSCELL